MRSLHPRLLWSALLMLGLPACWIIAGTEDFTDATPSGSGGSGGGTACVGSTCKTQGEPCGQASECATGLCTDGVCCDRSCDGPCRGCATMDNVGTCIDTPLGPDPESLCQGFGMCDGSGHCGEGAYQVGRLFGGVDTDQTAYSVAPTGDGGFFLAGYTNTQGSQWAVDNDVLIGATTIANLDWFFARFDAEGGSAFGNNLGASYLGANGFSDDQIIDVAIGEDGSIYMTGWLNGIIQFGVSDIGASNMDSDPEAALFKLAPNQQALWARSVGIAVSPERGRSVTLAPDGRVVWGGEKQDGMFVEVVEPDSTLVEQRVFGANSSDSVFDIAIAADSTMAIAGRYQNPVDFGNGATLAYDGPNESDAFVAVFDAPTGQARWAKQIGGPSAHGSVNAIAIGPGGDVYAGGFLRGTEANFDGQLVTLPPPGMENHSVAFVASYDASGQYRWHRLLSSGPGDAVTTLAVDTWGNVLAGCFASDAFSVGDATFTYAGGGDAVALKLTPDGEGIWARGFGDDQQQAFQRATFDGERFYLVGDTRGAIQGPNGSLLAHIGFSDIMFVVLTP